MTTATQTMTSCNSLAEASEKAIELSRKYEQSFLCEAIIHTAAPYIVFTHPPYLYPAETLLACYKNGEMINS